MRRFARSLVPFVWLVLLPVPFVAFLAAGWVHLRIHRGGGLIGTGLLQDHTSLNVWTLLAVLYFVWVVGLVVGTVWFLDRFGYHYEPYERPKRLTRRATRRREAGMAYLRSQQRDALRAAADESRRAAREAGHEDEQKE